MKDLLTWLSRRRYPYRPLIAVEISRSRLLGNLHAFQAYIRSLKPGALVAPVLKSNAYGHGLFEAAEILEKEARATRGSIPFFVVDSYFEAVALRAHGIRTPLLIIGYTRPETMIHSHLADTAFAVTSLDTLCQIARPDAPCPESVDETAHGRYPVPQHHRVRIHLKIDTGMHRQGIVPGETETAIALIKANHGLILEGICTHFSDADGADESFTEGQIAVWNREAARFRAAFPGLRHIHAAATDGSRFSKDIDGNAVRLGIGLYGLSENAALNSELALEPVLSMKTIVTGVKRLKAGETVGYGNSFRADCDMAIATIPVGYYEGLDRRLSSGPSNEAHGWIQVGPALTACPIIGRVSMNIATIDVSGVPDALAGMEAVVISRNAADPNSIASIAKNSAGTITYEIAVKIPAHLKRTVVE